MYHHVTNESIDITDSCRCTIEEFTASIDDLQKQGYDFVSSDSSQEIIRNRESRKFAVVTFDDVPDNFIVNAYPILKEKKIPFTLFITTGYLDKQGYLNKEQIIELAKDELCTIGAHTVSHPMLRQVDNSNDEIVQSKVILEGIIKKPVDFFAYPYGRQTAVSREVKKQVREAGFKCAFGTILAPVSDLTKSSMFFIPRMVYKGGDIEASYTYVIPFLNRLKRLFGLS